MKARLIKHGNIYTLLKDGKMIASTDKDFQSDYEVGKLSLKNCKEIFDVIEVEVEMDNVKCTTQEGLLSKFERFAKVDDKGYFIIKKAK
jgi:hypothetical protein